MPDGTDEHAETDPSGTETADTAKTVSLAQYQALQRKWEALRKQAGDVLAGRAEDMVTVAGRLERLEMGMEGLADVIGKNLQADGSNPLAPLKTQMDEHRGMTAERAKAFSAAQTFAFANDVDAGTDPRLAGYREAMEKRDYRAALAEVQGVVRSVGTETDEVRVDRLVDQKVAEKLKSLGKVDTGTTTAPPSKKPSLAELNEIDVSKMPPAARRAHDKSVAEAYEREVGLKYIG